MVNRTLYSLFLFAVFLFVVSACGVKKPPAPAYTFPGEFLQGPATSPTPGFNHPTGPINENNP